MSTLLNSTNILKLAFGAIPPRKIQWQKFASVSTNSDGTESVVYDDPIEITAHVQPINQNDYKAMGLDFNKIYKQVYALANIQDNSKQEVPDRLLFDNGVWNVISAMDWYVYNGWMSCTVVLDKRAS